jgi:hypothetical protein
MADEKKKPPEAGKRCCGVCRTDPASFVAYGRKCDGCGETTCKHVCSTSADGKEDFCRICTLRRAKAAKAKPPAPPPKKPDAKPDDKDAAS